MKMLESKIEKKLVETVKDVGGICIKLTGYKGIPDRMILRNGKIIFVELKREGYDLRPEQKIWKTKIENQGFIHMVVKSYEEIEAVKEMLQ